MQCRSYRDRLHRLLVTVVALAQVLVLVAAPRPAPATTGAPCVPYPGKDGPAGTLSGVSDVYYAPPAGTLAAGSTTVTLGTIDTGGGGLAAPAVGVGDELLIVQMQDGTFATTNSAAYGSGAALSSAGLYEYVYVSALAGSVATIVGAGAGNGLINTYHEAAATAGHGQQTYQIVRVPQYTTGTLSNNFHAAYWDGQTGGVAVLDLDSLLTLGSASVYATGNGFRGGGLTVAGSTPAGVLNNDYVDSAGMNGTNPPGQGSKAEGIFGTPANLFYYGTFTSPSAPAGAALISGTTDGYPGGDMAMGAPGNAGGGGTDDDPAANDQNTGGGGGSNGGAGGNGGYPWTPNYSNGNSPTGGTYSQVGVHAAANYATANGHDLGGRGASAIPGVPTVTRAFMGGGGGAGTNNNNSEDSTNPYAKYGSSGGVGGGIIMLRLSSTSGTASFIANGTTGLAPDNDGGGGGGAGGTVVLTAPSAFSGVTVNVNGAAGTTATRTGSTYGIQHGPGGGGGGGVALTSSAVTFSAAGGAAGTTTTFATNYGATGGATGSSATVTAAAIPGVSSGGECNGGASLVYLGPVTQGAAIGYNTTGQYDGSSPATNNNDFTAKAFFPAGVTMSNSSTTPGAWVGNAFSTGSATTINVPSELYYNNNPGAVQTLSVRATAPVAGWTAQVCNDNGLAGAADGPSCSNGFFTVGAAGQQATSTHAVAANTVVPATKFWVQYVIPAGASLTSYTRYDATVVASDTAGNRNETHHELYPGFVVLTKNYSLPANGGCPAGQTPPANGACPGALVTYSIDYRNIVVGAASEASFTGAWPWTGAGSFVITENGAAGSNNWGSSGFSCGLNEALVAAANGTTTFGTSTTGSTFTTATLHSTSFTATPGGSGFALVPSGIAATTGLAGVSAVGSQGTLSFRVRVTPSGVCP